MSYDFSKDHASLKSYFLGRSLHGALRAMEFAERYHTHQRRDGTPEFSHQIGLCRIINILPDINGMEEKLFITALLHDTSEDYKEVTNQILKDNFGPEIAEAVNFLDKTGRTEEAYFNNLLTIAPILSILVKGADRIHNLSTARGAFKPEKLEQYLKETTYHIRPILKANQKRHPELHRAFAAEITMLDLLVGALKP